MLKQSFLILSVVLSSCIYGQAYKDSIKVQFLQYTDLLSKKDFSKSTDFINPGFFKIIPKAQLITVIEKTYNNPALEFIVENPSIISVGDNQVIEKSNYVKLQYSNYLKMRFISEDGKKQDTALTKKALENQFGERNVSYDANTDYYRIFVIKNVVANSADKNKWTFVVVEEKQKPILEKFIPKELL